MRFPKQAPLDHFQNDCTHEWIHMSTQKYLHECL